ncbi:fumarate reductase/succinate dehydrogenase flavoprotein-like protein [Truncatella angustata]|uniref:Fumarate reductase/succinate dehydrogenase flavoprotein-like protein n=1 Tax=Truncatella angustata TaxID=152316 RepID=A0A9P8RK94_9PEZI|nr:fumarate reductase/succinate dehydrogenase flavoprotein-like protein [Truncatella angustata]KAH6647371.1 fumarate reductase/succinate dehydrogenase flavoprotein-like protein [Truncatella angustata]
MSSERTETQQRVIIVGGGLAGLVAAFELTQRNVPVLIIDQENEKNLGGQAFWSLGGIFMVNSSHQRRMGIKDSRELAMRDWFASARFDREKEDYWPRKWAEAFVNFATDEMEDYVKARGMGFLLNVGWAERGDGRADGHGNSVPRFHLTWGTGPEVVRVFSEPVLAAAKTGLVEVQYRHRVDELVIDHTGRAVGVRGRVLESDDSERGAKTNRTEVGDFEFKGSAVLVSSGGIGGNIEAVKAAWPVERLGNPPKKFVIGVPAHVDGRMIGITEKAGGNVINRDRMWHYTEGLTNWNPIWPLHGIRVLPAPSSLWLDATGKRLPPFLFPGSDTLATLEYIGKTGYDHTWFILDQTIIAREFALSGSEQNPDLTNKSIWQFITGRMFSSKGTTPVQNFQKHGEDFVVRDNLRDLVEGMNELVKASGGPVLDFEQIKEVVETRDGQMDNAYSKDAQAMLIHNARNYWPDRRGRVAPPHRILDPKHGPLIAVRMNILTRKTLGGLETNLSSNVMRSTGERFPGLYAAGEAAGFGGGGVHGYNSLEGTFLGGCIFSGRAAGRAIADEVLGEVVKSRETSKL